GGFEGTDDLVGVDLYDLHAGGDLVALGDQPVDDLPLGHRQPPLGHGDRVDALVAHERSQPTTDFAAFSTRCASGMYRSSKASLNGTGVCGAVTISIGARSAPNACCATVAEMSVARLQRGVASSTTTSRPVFSTLSR